MAGNHTQDNSKKSALVSIITPTYNSSRFIAEAIASIQSQTLEDYEHLIVDDGSSDDTASIVQSLAAKDSRIKLLRMEKNSGPAAARNLGISSAEGRYISFLDSDDIWLSNKLQVQVEFMTEHGVALSYTDYERLDEDSTEKIGTVISPVTVSYDDLRRSNQIACSTAMYDSALIGKILMPMIRKRQDWGLWLRIAEKGYAAHNVGQLLVRYRVRSNSVSSNKVNALVHTWTFFRNVVGMGPIESSWRLVLYAWTNSLKYRRSTRLAKKQASE